MPVSVSPARFTDGAATVPVLIWMPVANGMRCVVVDSPFRAMHVESPVAKPSISASMRSDRILMPVARSAAHENRRTNVPEPLNGMPDPFAKQKGPPGGSPSRTSILDDGGAVTPARNAARPGSGLGDAVRTGSGGGRVEAAAQAETLRHQHPEIDQERQEHRPGSAEIRTGPWLQRLLLSTHGRHGFSTQYNRA